MTPEEQARRERELDWLRRAAQLSRLLVLERDPAQLIPLILDAAQELTGAERGYLVRLGPERGGARALAVEAAVGFEREALRGRAGEVSRSVVERVLDTGRGVVTTREEDADLLDASSVQRRRVCAMICAPLRLRGEVRGVLYLDHRSEARAFDEEDLAILGIFADQAALALESAGAGPSTPPAAPPRAPLVFGGLVGDGPAMSALYAQIARVAGAWDPVLVVGEAGTGKELVAREVHARSPLPRQPLLSVACGAGREEELEQELFGVRRGGRARGALERAERGTLILREVGELPLPLQARLVEVLRQQRAGAPGAACRIVATTRQDLRAAAAAGRFREDLLYRLDVQRLVVPPLRARREDLPALLDHFAERQRGARLELTPAAREALQRYAWPGNVLELQNEVARLCALPPGPVTPAQLSAEVRGGRGAPAAAAVDGRTLAEVEQAMVEAALAAHAGNKSRAARQLGIPRTTLYSLIERYGLA